MSELVLSLFPGIGLLDRAFEEAGFCVVRGPDVLWGGDVRQFHPPAGRFTGIIGGPPCQAFSQLVHIVRANGHEPRHGNLIPEFERCVAEAQPEWFVMENVPRAPEPAVAGYGIASVIVNNRWVGGEQNRVRRFSFGLRGLPAPNVWRYLEVAPLEPVAEYRASAVLSKAPPKIGVSGKLKRVLPAAVTGNSGGRRAVAVRDADGRLRGHQGEADWQRLNIRSIKELCELQGLPADFLREAPFTVAAKRQVIANGVPLPLGRAVARAVVAMRKEQEQAA